MIAIKYQVTYSTQEVTEAEYALVRSLYNVEQKVIAIKFIRVQYSLGLKEAKDICDAIVEMGRGW